MKYLDREPAQVEVLRMLQKCRNLNRVCPSSLNFFIIYCICIGWMCLWRWEIGGEESQIGGGGDGRGEHCSGDGHWRVWCETGGEPLLGKVIFNTSTAFWPLVVIYITASS